MVASPEPPEEMVAVYSAPWNRLARIMYWSILVVAVMAVTGGISAVITDGSAAMLYAAITVVFAAACLAVRTFYNVEPVWASTAGVWVERQGSRRVIPWARVGTPKPRLGVHVPIVMVSLPVEGERRPVRFVAGRQHREALQSERDRARRAPPP